MTLFLFSVVLAYVMGSICSAVIVCRLFSLPDPRQEGSKNPGATNVLRLAGKHYAALVMLGDVLKGTIPVLIAKVLGADPIILGFTCLAAVVGHMYPVFFEFKGGKGVATAIGALLGFHLIIGVLVIATWLLVAQISKHSSLASITAITLSPFYNFILIGEVGSFPPLIFMVMLIIYKHKDNITRLMNGTEPKIILKSTVIKEVMEASPPDEHPGAETLAVTPIKVTKAKKPTNSTKPKKSAEVEKTTKKKPAVKTKSKKNKE